MPRPWQGLDGITVQPGGVREKQESKGEARVSSGAGALWGFHLDPRFPQILPAPCLPNCAPYSGSVGRCHEVKRIPSPMCFGSTELNT